MIRYIAHRNVASDVPSRSATRADLVSPRCPLDGNRLMEHFGRGPGRWIKELKDYLEGEVVEGRLRKDDTEIATRLAEEYAREHNLFGED